MPVTRLSRHLRLTVLMLIALLALPGLGLDTALAQQPSDSELKALKSRIAEIDRWLKGAEKDRSRQQQQLASIESNISKTLKQQRDLQQKLANTQTELGELEARAKTLEKDLKQREVGLREQIRSAWKQGDSPAIKLLLNEDDPSSVARSLTYHRYLSDAIQQKIDAFNNDLRELRQAQVEVSKAREELKQVGESLKAREVELTAQRRDRQEAVAALGSQIKDRRKLKSALEADQNRLQNLVQEVETAVNDIPIPAQNKPFSDLKGRLPWPVKGKLLSGYGVPLADGQLRQRGLMIRASEDQPVRAVHTGRVVFANWLRGAGLLIIVDHGEGYLSLYGHNNSLLVDQGDWVRGGDELALSGSSGGAGEPRLYFEIRRKGKPINPLPWLSRR